MKGRIMYQPRNFGTWSEFLILDADIGEWRELYCYEPMAGHEWFDVEKLICLLKLEFDENGVMNDCSEDGRNFLARHWLFLEDGTHIPLSLVL